MSIVRPIDRFLERVHNPRKNANGGFSCKCPAHQDGSPSLSVKEGRDGRLLLNCFAGCKFRDILAAVGLTEADAFAGERTNQKNYMSRSALLTEIFIVQIFEANPNEADRPRYRQAIQRIGKTLEG